MPRSSGARNRPRLETEENTLEILEGLPPVLRGLAVAVYIVASYWPWWLTFLVPSFALWRIYPGVKGFAWATAAFAALAVGGSLVKAVIERFAPRWVARS